MWLVESVVGHFSSVVVVVISRRYERKVYSLVAAVGLDEMASREVLEGVIERLRKATLKSTGEEFQQTQKNLEALEKEHKRVVHQIGELNKRESKLIIDRDKAKESAKNALERVSEMENKQYVKQSAAAARVKPEKVSGSGNDTDFRAYFGPV